MADYPEAGWPLCAPKDPDKLSPRPTPKSLPTPCLWLETALDDSDHTCIGKQQVLVRRDRFTPLEVLSNHEGSHVHSHRVRRIPCHWRTRGRQGERRQGKADGHLDLRIGRQRWQ